MMKIEVTQEHIDGGEMTNPISCPVALALAEATGLEFWSVWGDHAERDRALIDLPKEAADFVGFFDQGDSVQPFSFDFDWAPDED